MKEYLTNLFPKAPSSVELLVHYLESINYPHPKKLGEAQLKQLLNAMYEDFINFKLDIDGFSDLCGKFQILSQETDTKNTEIAFKLQEYSEIEWDIRKDPKKAAKTLEELKKYLKL